MAQVLCKRELNIGPGKGQYIDVVDVEQWFSVLVYAPEGTAPSSGHVVFGDMVLHLAKQFYPSKDTGYKYIDWSQIEGKNPSTIVQGNGVVTFFGQPSTGCLGIWNATDVDLHLVISSIERVIEER